MATKTFSSRVNEEKLAFADGLVRKRYGISYGQYCGTVLLDDIEATGRLPKLNGAQSAEEKKRAAVSFIKGFASKAVHPEIGSYSDADVRDLIASRYEA